jgi:APA family basic amino acid/polyamine antiporter
MAVMALSGALCYSELAARFPQSGGEYVYLREGFGERVAFLFGWMSAAVIDPGLAAALAVGASVYVLAILPLPHPVATILPALILLALAAIHYFGTRLSSRLMTAANLIKVLVLFALVIWAVAAHRGSLANLLPFSVRRPGSEPLALALAGGVLITFAFLYVAPLERIVSNTAFVAQFGTALFGSAGSRILSGCVLLSVIGGLMALTMACPRVYYAMAKDGNFFPAFARLHPRFGSPVNGILLQCGLGILLLSLGAFDRILAYIIFSAVVFLALSVTTLFRLERRVERWWYPAAPVVFLLGCTVIGLLILLRSPVPALLGVLMVLAGEVLRYFFFPARKLTTAGS